MFTLLLRPPLRSPRKGNVRGCGGGPGMLCWWTPTIWSPFLAAGFPMIPSSSVQVVQEPLEIQRSRGLDLDLSSFEDQLAFRFDRDRISRRIEHDPVVAAGIDDLDLLSILAVVEQEPVPALGFDELGPVVLAARDRRLVPAVPEAAEDHRLARVALVEGDEHLGALLGDEEGAEVFAGVGLHHQAI